MQHYTKAHCAVIDIPIHYGQKVSKGRGGKRDKWVPNIAYFCAMVLRTHCMGHCLGLYGKYGIPVRGGGGGVALGI